MFGLKSFLSYAVFYKFLQNSLGAEAIRKEFVEKYICPKQGDKVLDIGCGPACILKYFPEEVQYYGFDPNRHYIEAAIKRYGERGHFTLADISNVDLSSYPEFDLIIAFGVLHHLDDNMYYRLMEISKKSLAPGGKLITLDTVYTNEQPWHIKFLISKDRGRHVRCNKEYVDLARKHFDTVQYNIRDDLAKYPINYIMMECS